MKFPMNNYSVCDSNSAKFNNNIITSHELR